MKKATLLFFLIASKLCSLAQPDKYAAALMTAPSILFEQQQVTYNGNSKPATTFLVIADGDEYLKDWKNFLEAKYAITGKRVSGFNASVGVVVADWSPDSLSLFYKTIKEGDASRMFLMLEKNEKFLDESSDVELFQRVKMTLKQQTKDFYLKQYEMHLAQQQKQYNNQINDYEKLKKQEEKLNKSIINRNEAKQNTDSDILETNAKLAEKRNEIRAQNLNLEQNKKAVDQAAKEVNAQTNLIQTKEVEYNKLNGAGNLNTKAGEKVIKELESLRGKMEKLQGKLTDSNETQTKSENELLKLEQSESKLQTNITKLHADVDKYDAEINASKTELDRNAQELKDEQRQIDEAKGWLEKLQSAKASLMNL